MRNERALPKTPQTIPISTNNNSSPSFNISLSNEEKYHLFQEGYVIVRNVVPKEKVDLALRVINQELGYGLSKEDMELAKKGTYCPEVATSIEITNLFNSTPLMDLVKSAVGPKIPIVHSGQIALRFPGQFCTDKYLFQPVPWWNSGWHIDGFSDKNNNIEKNKIENFTCLVGVALSNAENDFMGNLVVYPRSHHYLENYFRREGFEKVRDSLGSLPEMVLPEPIQVKLQAGDIVIAQYALAHSIAPNTCSSIRYQIYFRIHVRETGKHHPDAMTDIWSDWEGMKEVSNQKKEAMSSTGAKSKPFYADGRRLIDEEKQFQRNDELSVIKAKAEQLFKENKHLECAPLWDQLATERPQDFMCQLHASLCYYFGPDEHAPKGERFCKRMIELAPQANAGYALYAGILLKCKRYAECIQYATQYFKLPAQGDEGMVIGVVSGCVESMSALNYSSEEMVNILNTAISVYPDYRVKLEELRNPIKSKLLWKKGHEWLTSPNKNFDEGEKIFLEITIANPNDIWATLLVGGCLTWNQKYVQGEGYIRKAISLSPEAAPNGYALLCQNLLQQGKPSEIPEIVNKMLSYTFPSVATDNDHKEKIFEALECLGKVVGIVSPTFKEAIQKAKKSYPFLDQQLSQFEKTGKKEENCIIS